MSRDERRARNIRADLEQRGVASALSLPISEKLEGLTRELPADAYEAVLSSVALATRTQHGDEVPQAALDAFHEIERLMGAFGTELKKLEESLETLAAYVTRMRTVAGSGGNVLH